MQEHAPHVSPIKNWKQLIVVVVLAFVVPIALAVILSQWVTSGVKGMHEDDSAIIKRIQPVGQVLLAVASGPKGQLTGEQVYNQVCKTCHETAVAGAHKIGDKAAWAKVLAQGQAVTVDHAITGIRAMPAKGGNPDLENVEVERAIVYMTGKAGGNWKEPAAAPSTAKGAERTGQQVVELACGKCHQTGEQGAPVIGDRAAWTRRVKGGFALVLQSALKGHAGMPARGGMAELSDVEIRRAVEFMLNSGAGGARAAASPVMPVVAATPAAATATASTATGRPDGKKIYDTTCVACHAAGVAGAPKFGDKAAWAPRLKTGIAALYATALAGKGAMPAKGGAVSLSDADIKAAVDYIAAAAR
jgi:cytochrome c5